MTNANHEKPEERASAPSVRRYLFMRVSIGIHAEDVDAAIETYHLMSQRFCIHATPTLFNAGTNYPQMSNPCFSMSITNSKDSNVYTISSVKRPQYTLH